MTSPKRIVFESLNELSVYAHKVGILYLLVRENDKQEDLSTALVDLKDYEEVVELRVSENVKLFGDSVPAGPVLKLDAWTWGFLVSEAFSREDVPEAQEYARHIFNISVSRRQR